jgi:hypothetical protein
VTDLLCTKLQREAPWVTYHVRASGLATNSGEASSERGSSSDFLQKVGNRVFSASGSRGFKISVRPRTLGVHDAFGLGSRQRR